MTIHRQEIHPLWLFPHFAENEEFDIGPDLWPLFDDKKIIPYNLETLAPLKKKYTELFKEETNKRDKANADETETAKICKVASVLFPILIGIAIPASLIAVGALTSIFAFITVPMICLSIGAIGSTLFYSIGKNFEKSVSHRKIHLHHGFLRAYVMQRLFPTAQPPGLTMIDLNRDGLHDPELIPQCLNRFPLQDEGEISPEDRERNIELGTLRFRAMQIFLERREKAIQDHNFYDLVIRVTKVSTLSLIIASMTIIITAAVLTMVTSPITICLFFVSLGSMMNLFMFAVNLATAYQKQNSLIPFQHCLRKNRYYAVEQALDERKKNEEELAKITQNCLSLFDMGSDVVNIAIEQTNAEEIIQDSYPTGDLDVIADDAIPAILKSERTVISAEPKKRLIKNLVTKIETEKLNDRIASAKKNFLVGIVYNVLASLLLIPVGLSASLLTGALSIGICLAVCITLSRLSVALTSDVKEQLNAGLPQLISHQLILEYRKEIREEVRELNRRARAIRIELENPELGAVARSNKRQERNALIKKRKDKKKYEAVVLNQISIRALPEFYLVKDELGTPVNVLPIDVMKNRNINSVSKRLQFMERFNKAIAVKNTRMELFVAGKWLTIPITLVLGITAIASIIFASLTIPLSVSVITILAVTATLTVGMVRLRQYFHRKFVDEWNEYRNLFTHAGAAVLLD